MRIILAISVLLISLCNAAYAATPSAVEKRHTEAYYDCLNNGDAAQGIQSAMNTCAKDEYVRQDGRLNQAYIMVMKQLKTNGKNKLRTSQRAWLKQRDKTCAVERSEYEGGSMAPMMFNSCMANQTIKRTMWLENYR